MQLKIIFGNKFPQDTKQMSDHAMMCTVREEFAPRLPTALTGLILDFANPNEELKEACLEELALIERIIRSRRTPWGVSFSPSTMLHLLEIYEPVLAQRAHYAGSSDMLDDDYPGWREESVRAGYDKRTRLELLADCVFCPG